VPPTSYNPYAQSCTITWFGIGAPARAGGAVVVNFANPYNNVLVPAKF